MSIRDSLRNFPEFTHVELDDLVSHIEWLIAETRDLRRTLVDCSDPKTVSRRFKRMSSACKTLIADIRDDDAEGFHLADHLASHWNDRPPGERPEVLGSTRLIEQLEALQWYCERYHRLGLTFPGPGPINNGRDQISGWAWPHLFALWTSTTGGSALTQDGSQHRFITAVHEYAGFTDPVFSSLKKAHGRWKKRPTDTPNVLRRASAAESGV